MKTFKQYLLEAELKTLYANCVNAFNSKTGNRKKSCGLVPYRDATDFAQHVTDDNNNNKDELKITKDEFLKHVKVAPEHEKYLNDPKTEYLYSSERDSHILYAPNDVHHFYERK